MTLSVAERASAREPYFRELLDEFLQDGWLEGADVELQPDSPRLLSETYFLLNDAYKAYRLPEGHRTDRAKIAGVKTAVILAVAPFVPLDVLNAADMRTPLANPIFAAACATSVLQVDRFMRMSPDARMRFLSSILRFSKYPCLDNYFRDPSSSRADRLNLIDLSRFELYGIETLVSIYEGWRPISGISPLRGTEQ